jgi:epoxyqueuosine reductase
MQTPPGNDSERLRGASLLLIKGEIQRRATEFGFDRMGVSQTDPGPHRQYLDDWLSEGFAGEMTYLSRYRDLRVDPALLFPGALRVLSFKMDYLPEQRESMWNVLERTSDGYIARYALGRDYHKLIRTRLARLMDHISQQYGPFRYRVFSDSAPILEKAYAAQSGLGWIGKHTNLIDRERGSFFFLGDVLTDLPLPVDEPASAHCGSCSACLDICPTQAIIAPFVLDARRCIAYLTIELKGSIPLELRKAIGNRIYGCDDCQLVCPWNRYARITLEPDFLARKGLESAPLTALFSWDEATFMAITEGSAIRRIGHQSWLRNIAVALGNGPPSPSAIEALKIRLDDPSAIVREHTLWALDQLEKAVDGPSVKST